MALAFGSEREEQSMTTTTMREAETARTDLSSLAPGDATLLGHPIALELLRSTLPARLAYTARDGAPRVVPMQFHWTGDAVVLGSWPDDPKVAALRAHPQVALTLDTTQPPFRVLQIRGTAKVTIVAGVSDEMAAAAERYMGPEGGRAWVEQVARLSSHMARIAVRPEWVDVLDFETRLPGGMTRRLGAG
jgi:PPOX class probable F420-dependent enzyme